MKFNVGDFVKVNSLNGICKIVKEDAKRFLLQNEDDDLFWRLKVDVELYGTPLNNPHEYERKLELKKVFKDILEIVSKNHNLKFNIHISNEKITLDGLGEMPNGEIIPMLAEVFEL